MALKGNTIAFYEGQRIASQRNFSLLIKPLGSACNLRCKYCYYLDKSALYGGKEPMIDDSLLEHIVKQYIEASDSEEVSFCWHGGEPLLAGIGFYSKAIEYQKKYANGKTISNSLQTNGTLITDDWAHFFYDNNFLIGVSIDGPKEIHDAFRNDVFGRNTWEATVRGIERLFKSKVEYNTLSTVNHYSENHGLEVYQFLKKCGTNYMQFLPVVEHTNKQTQRITSPSESNTTLAPWSVKPLAFGQFMCDIFDYWVKYDVGQTYVQLFDATLAKYADAAPGICIFDDTCGDNLVVEHNGDVYVCDHFVYQDFKLGNLKQHSIRELVDSSRCIDFGQNKRNTLPRDCRQCSYLFACTGECPKHRFVEGKNALCEGYKRFYQHTESYFKFMLNELKGNRAPSNVMNITFNQ